MRGAVMRSLARNRQPFAYAHALEAEEIFDEYGHRTGAYRQAWSAKIETEANISPDKGAVGVEAFGAFADYDRVICYTVDDGIGLREMDAVWIDADPSGKHDYVVRRIGRSLNSILAAVKKVDVS